MTTIIKTRVGIVGAGPAGLMLSHLLAKSGIDNVAIDTRPRDEIETTHRASILEDSVVKTIVDSGVSDRVHTDGYEHHSIELRFDRAGHRIDFAALVNASCWLYPQTDLFIAAHGDIVGRHLERLGERGGLRVHWLGSQAK